MDSKNNLIHLSNVQEELRNISQTNSFKDQIQRLKDIIDVMSLTNSLIDEKENVITIEIKAAFDKVIDAQCKALSCLRSKINTLPEMVCFFETHLSSKSLSSPEDIIARTLSCIQNQELFRSKVKTRLTLPISTKNYNLFDFNSKNLSSNSEKKTFSDLIKHSEKIQADLEKTQQEYEKQSRYSSYYLLQDLLKIFRESCSLEEIEFIYKKISSLDSITTLLPYPTGLWNKQRYLNCIHQVCIIRSLEIIRNQFRICDSQWSEQTERLHLTLEEKKKFSKFLIKLVKNKKTYSVFPSMPFYIKTTTGWQLIDLCIYLKELLSLNDGINYQDIINEHNWNLLVDKLFRSPIEAFFKCSIEQRSAFFTPFSVKELTKETLTSFGHVVNEIRKDRASQQSATEKITDGCISLIENNKQFTEKSLLYVTPQKDKPNNLDITNNLFHYRQTV